LNRTILLVSTSMTMKTYRIRKIAVTVTKKSRARIAAYEETGQLEAEKMRQACETFPLVLGQERLWHRVAGNADWCAAGINKNGLQETSPFLSPQLPRVPSSSPPLPALVKVPSSVDHSWVPDSPWFSPGSISWDPESRYAHPRSLSTLF
jgi:hypothetical protein